MNEQQMLNGQVREWQVEGRWVDRGRWKRAENGTLEYLPTKCEIAAKCKLFRTLRGWRGAHKRAPRGGEFAVETTARVCPAKLPPRRPRGRLSRPLPKVGRSSRPTV